MAEPLLSDENFETPLCATGRTDCSCREIHLGHLRSCCIELLCVFRIDRLLALHSTQHHLVVRLQGSNVVSLALEGGFRVAHGLHALAEAVLRHQCDELSAMLLFGVPM